MEVYMSRLIKTVAEKAKKEQKMKVCTTIKRETYEALEKLAKEAEVSITFMLGELLEFGMKFGENIDLMQLGNNILIERSKASKKPIKKGK
jgi:hypothetical protein